MLCSHTLAENDLDKSSKLFEEWERNKLDEFVREYKFVDVVACRQLINTWSGKVGDDRLFVVGKFLAPRKFYVQEFDGVVA